MPEEFWMWKIAMDTGWTLEYIESLSIEQYHQWFQFKDAEVKARNTSKGKAGTTG